ncbi:MAG: presqualene diphosphate synthase HpnD [Thiobacillaceae bacterium]|nr:presqualene diphosphate synthase HpnD [Thiobacillaceae bacterium]
MDPHRYCRAKVAASGSSFLPAFRLLEPARRRALTAFYAFCREVDDIVDECREPVVARAKLAWWRAEVERLYAGAPQHPVARALGEYVERYAIAREQLMEIMDGVEMDLEQSRYADFRALRLYCHRVAGVVGEVSAQIFGYSERGTLKYAALLGLALQLTNIIRDVGEDARRGRIYLPLDELAAHGVVEADILAGRSTPAFARLMEFQYQRAEAAFDEALARLPRADRRRQRPGLAMAAIYRTLLREIRRDGFRVLEHRVLLPPARKLLIAWRAWLAA